MNCYPAKKELRILILAVNDSLIRPQLRKLEIPFYTKTVETRNYYIRELHDFAPDLILSHYYLPAFTGLEALTIAREHSLDVPFILIMEELSEEYVTELLMRGVTDILLKDDLSILHFIIRNIFRKAKET